MKIFARALVVLALLAALVPFQAFAQNSEDEGTFYTANTDTSDVMFGEPAGDLVAFCESAT